MTSFFDELPGLYDWDLLFRQPWKRSSRNQFVDEANNKNVDNGECEQDHTQEAEYSHTRRPDDHHVPHELTKLQKLKHLSLGHASYHQQTEKVIDIFNLRGFDSLQLRSCPGTRRLRETLTHSGEELSLSSLEVVEQEIPPWSVCHWEYKQYFDSRVGEAIPGFVSKLTSLFQLCLHLDLCNDWTEIGRNVLLQRSLRHLVLHGGSHPAPTSTVIVDGDDQLNCIFGFLRQCKTWVWNASAYPVSHYSL